MASEQRLQIIEDEKDTLKHTVYLNLIGTLQKVWCSLLCENDTIILPNKKFNTKRVLTDINHSISIVANRMKLVNHIEFTSNSPKLSNEINRELCNIQNLINDIPLASEKPLVQESFTKLNFLVRRLVHS